MYRNKEIDVLIERYPQLSCIADDLYSSYKLIEDSYKIGGKLLIAGNGGSAADAEHIVGELMKGFKLPEKLMTHLQHAYVRQTRNLVMFSLKTFKVLYRQSL